MMNVSPDVLSYSNPALAALVIYAYVRGFCTESSVPPHFALAYLPVPIALSREISRSFEGTNVKTGLLSWIQRNPLVRIELAEQVRSARDVSRSGLIFALQRQVVTLDQLGRLVPNPKALRGDPKDPLGAQIDERFYTVAMRFGVWCGVLDSPKAVFSALELAP